MCVQRDNKTSSFYLSTCTENGSSPVTSLDCEVMSRFCHNGWFTWCQLCARRWASGDKRAVNLCGVGEIWKQVWRQITTRIHSEWWCVPCGGQDGRKINTTLDKKNKTNLIRKTAQGSSLRRLFYHWLRDTDFSWRMFLLPHHGDTPTKMLKHPNKTCSLLFSLFAWSESNILWGKKRLWKPSLERALCSRPTVLQNVAFSSQRAASCLTQEVNKERGKDT